MFTTGMGRNFHGIDAQENICTRVRRPPESPNSGRYLSQCFRSRKSSYGTSGKHLFDKRAMLGFDLVRR
jgi:hypothetical protein